MKYAVSDIPQSQTRQIMANQINDMIVRMRRV